MRTLLVGCVVVALCSSVRAGGPNMHWAQGFEALYHIQDPELRALLKLDELLEFATPWDEDPYFATIRIEVVNGTPYLVGRRVDGIQAYRLGEDGKWAMVSHASQLCDDLAGWNQPRYYDTIRTEVIGDDLYVVARSSLNVRVYKLDTTTDTWSALPSLEQFGDGQGYDKPEYYETMRTAAVGNDLYLLIRGADGVHTRRLDTTTGEWSSLQQLSGLSDVNGWTDPKYYDTIRTEVAGTSLYLMARGATQLYAFRLDTVSGAWTGTVTFPVLTDALGFDLPKYYETIRTDVVGTDVYLLCRSSVNVRCYRLDTVAFAWSGSPSLNAMKDSLGWGFPQYYQTLRTTVIGDSLYLTARSSVQMGVWMLDTTPGGSWTALPPMPGGVGDAQGYGEAPYYDTIRTESVGDDLLLLIRSADGMRGLILDTPTGAWTQLGTQPAWADDGGFDNDGPGGKVIMYGPLDSEAKEIYLAYQSGLWFPDAFNNYPLPVNPLVPPEVWTPHDTGFLYEYAQAIRNHLFAVGGVEFADARLVAHFLGCLAHVVGDYRFDRYFVQRVSEECGVEVEVPVVGSMEAIFYFPGIEAGTSIGAQCWTDIVLDLTQVDQTQAEFGVPKQFSTYYVPQVVWLPGGVLDQAYPHLDSSSDVEFIVTNTMAALAGFITDPVVGPNYDSLNVGQCEWSQENYRTALGGIQDGGRVIADAIDRTWALLGASDLPRYESGNQANQYFYNAQNEGKILPFPWTDLSIGEDVGVPGFDYDSFPGYEVAEQVDLTAWARTREDVLQYETRGEIIVALMDAPDGLRLEANSGFIGDNWYDWTPPDLVGLPLNSFQMERTPWPVTTPVTETLRIAVLLEGGSLYAFERSLSGSSAAAVPSPNGWFLADGVDEYQLERDEIAMLIGGNLHIQTGLAGQAKKVATGVRSFELEDDRVGVLAGGDLLVRDHPRQPFVQALGHVADFDLDGTAIAALMTDDSLRARWDWSSLSTLDVMTDDDGWHLPQYHETIRVASVGRYLYVLGRGESTLHCYELDTRSNIWSVESLNLAGVLADEDGWAEPQYYETIRTEVIGHDLYVVARSSLNVRVYKLDTATDTWSALPSLEQFGDGQGYDKPEYYETMRTAAVGTDLLLLIRGSDGVHTRKLDTTTGEWSSLPLLSELSDDNGWDSYYGTIQTEVVGSALYLICETANDWFTFRLDTATESSWDLVQALNWSEIAVGGLGDKQALRTEVVGGEILLMRHTSFGVDAYRLTAGADGGASGWQLVSQGEPDLPFTGDWTSYASSFRTTVHDGDLYLCVRSTPGVSTWRLDGVTRTWQTVGHAFPNLWDAGGWNQDEYGSTMRLVSGSDRLYLLARSPVGIEGYALEPDGSTWRTLGTDVAGFQLEAGRLASLSEGGLDVVQLGQIPATLGAGETWVDPPVVSVDDVSEFALSPSSWDRSPKWHPWLMWLATDGTSYTRRLIPHKQWGQPWRHTLPVPKELGLAGLLQHQETGDDWLADRLAVLIGGELYQQELRK